MSIKVAAIIALIGLIINSTLIVLANLNSIQWSTTLSIISLVFGTGSLIVFFATLILKQK